MKKKYVKFLSLIMAAAIAGSLTLAGPMELIAQAASTSSTSSSSSSAAPGGQVPSGQAPDGNGSAPNGDSSTTPPDKPDGDTSSDGSTPPEMPSGDSSNTTGDASNGISAPDGQAPSDGGTAPEGGNGAPGGSSQAVTEYSATTEYTEDTETTDETYDSTGADMNSLLVSSGSVVLNNPTITRTSSDSTGGDNASFYGVGAALLGVDGTTYVNGGTITTDSAGGAGIFSYGDNVTYAKGVTINTEQNTSGGVHVAGGGTLYAWGLDVTTNGASAAAIRSDRGGGTMVIDGGSYTSNGSGSPAIYCTADIAVNDATLAANGSEGICIEGLNSLSLFDSDLTCNMPDDEQNDNTWSVILYQSMSGDAEEGNATFEMVGGSITSENGGIFYTTNTESTFYINNVDITAADDSEYFLRCTGNNNQRGWGSSGANGAQCNFTAASQTMNGDIIWDSISTLDLYITDQSQLNGAIIDDESCAGNGGDGYCNVYITKDSMWQVTGDSTVTNLYNAGKIADADGNTVTIKGTDGTVYVEGTSEYTVTCESYSTSCDTSGSAYADSDVPSFSTHEVDVPEYLTADAVGTVETKDLTDSEDSASTSSLPIVPIAVGGGIAVVAIGAIVLVRRKRH